MLSTSLLTAVAGGCSGMAVDFLLYPLDTIKTRRQARNRGLPLPSAASFYRGLFSAMLGSAPSAATFWVVYEGTKHAALPYCGEWSSLAHAGGAAAADLVVCLVRNPFEVVKQQMQAGLHSGTSIGAAKRIFQTDGFRGFYAGYGSTVLREIPFDAIEFTIYESLKQRMLHRKRSEAKRHAELREFAATIPPTQTPVSAIGQGEDSATDLVFWENAAAGSFAGAIAAFVTTPLDVIKTRLMTQSKAVVTTASATAATVAATVTSDIPSTSRDRPYTGWSDALRRILKEEGPRALMSGVVPRVTWIALGGAIFIGSFEELKRRLTEANGGKGTSTTRHA